MVKNTYPGKLLLFVRIQKSIITKKSKEVIKTKKVQESF